MTGPLVSSQIRLRPVVGGRALRAPVVYMTLSYDPAQPYEVRLTENGRDPVARVFARELLNGPLGGSPAGLDSVRVRLACISQREDPLLELTLQSPEGAQVFAASPRSVSVFLADTYDLVPEGDEVRYMEVPQTPGELLGTSS